MEEITLKVDCIFNKIGKVLLFGSFVLGGLSIFVYTNFPPSIVYFIGASIIAFITGIIFYTGCSDSYIIIKPDSRQILHYKKNFYFKKEKEILFNQVKSIEIHGEKVKNIQRKQGRRQSGPEYLYMWCINLITVNKIVLRLTDKVSGPEDGLYLMEEEGKKIAEIIGCPAIIKASHLPVKSGYKSLSEKPV